MMDNKNVYAGAFSIYLSLMDAKINFMSVDPIVDEETGRITGDRKESVATITLSLPLAKQLSEKLTAAIQQYELDVAPVLSFEDKTNPSNEQSVK